MGTEVAGSPEHGKAATARASIARATPFVTMAAEIALLDAAYDAGRIDNSDYVRRRSLLLAQARKLLQKG